jgi:hypothetical protein
MEAQLSAPSMVLVTLEERLEACVSPEDEDVVAGILALIFSALPAAVVSCKYDQVIKKAGLAEVSELRDLTRTDLISLSVPLGHAKKILRLLQPSGSPQPSGPIPTVVGQQPTIKISVKAIPALFSFFSRLYSLFLLLQYEFSQATRFQLCYHRRHLPYHLWYKD